MRSVALPPWLCCCKCVAQPSPLCPAHQDMPAGGQEQHGSAERAAGSGDDGGAVAGAGEAAGPKAAQSKAAEESRIIMGVFLTNNHPPNAKRSQPLPARRPLS